MRISDWSSDVCSSDLPGVRARRELEPDRDGRVLALPVGVVHPRLEVRQRRLALQAVREHPLALVGQALVVQGIERPHDRQTGSASCRARVCQYVYISVVAVHLKKKKNKKSI